jgi:hypothetical protein
MAKLLDAFKHVDHLSALSIRRNGFGRKAMHTLLSILNNSSDVLEELKLIQTKVSADLITAMLT